jgi:hypothetical protein
VISVLTPMSREDQLSDSFRNLISGGIRRYVPEFQRSHGERPCCFCRVARRYKGTESNIITSSASSTARSSGPETATKRRNLQSRTFVSDEWDCTHRKRQDRDIDQSEKAVINAGRGCTSGFTICLLKHKYDSHYGHLGISRWRLCRQETMTELTV